jgi:hypothetical protein
MDRRLVILFLTIFIDLMGFGIFIPVVPFVARDLGASDALVGDTAVVFSVLMYLFGPFWGAVSDRYGRRPVIAIAVAISGVSYLLFSFAHGIVLLFISRMLTGVGSANIAAAQAYITDITPPENRAKSLGLVGAAFGLGFIAGPPLGGVVYHYLGTEWVGYVAAGHLPGEPARPCGCCLPESLHQRDGTPPSGSSADHRHGAGAARHPVPRPLPHQLHLHHRLQHDADDHRPCCGPTTMASTRHRSATCSRRWAWPRAIVQGGLLGWLQQAPSASAA